MNQHRYTEGNESEAMLFVGNFSPDGQWSFYVI